MKKPNLTDGEWEVHLNSGNHKASIGPKGMSGSHALAGVFKNSSYHKDPHPWRANAKAISAVPEMIDVLMEILEEGSFYNSAIELDFNADGEIIEHKIRKALKKAGCTEDEILNND